MLVIRCINRGNVMREGENACYQHFTMFPKVFQRASCIVSLKPGIVLVKVYINQRIMNIYTHTLSEAFKALLFYLETPKISLLAHQTPLLKVTL